MIRLSYCYIEELPISVRLGYPIVILRSPLYFAIKLSYCYVEGLLFQVQLGYPFFL